MIRKQFKRTFIRHWRERAGLSLRDLANRLETEPGGEPVASHATIGRIENGKQPYSQPIIEAISAALDVPIPLLLNVDPTKEGEVIDYLAVLNKNQRAQAVEYLRFLARK